MFRITSICFIGVLWISFINNSSGDSGEPCAQNVEIKKNGTGHYLTWSDFGEGCGPRFWFRSGRAYYDAPLTPSPMLITIRGASSLICSGDCASVRNLNVSKVITSVSTKRTTTSEPLGNTNDTPASRGTEGDSSTVVVAVAAICSVVVLGLVVVLIVCVVKRRRPHHKPETVPAVNNGRTLRREDINHIVHVDGPENEDGTYSEIGAVSNRPNGTRQIAARPDHRQEPAAVGDMYAIVQKPKKDVQNHGDDDLANDVTVDPASMYAQVQKPTKAAQPLVPQEHEHHQNQEASRKQNKDGLIYLDVEFSNSSEQNQSEEPLLNSQQDGCEYAEVAHS
ncbi:uncharacterized protein [Argopecten irradians]|uniref:uncharacterized protein isoform X2 n=1 Tax=Argopecten irradians TaxID=31199 RepID=UPI00371F80E4